MKSHSTSTDVFVELSSSFIFGLRVLIVVRRCVKDLLPSSELCKADARIREFCLYIFCVGSFLLCACF